VLQSPQIGPKRFLHVGVSLADKTLGDNDLIGRPWLFPSTRNSCKTIRNYLEYNCFVTIDLNVTSQTIATTNVNIQIKFIFRRFSNKLFDLTDIMSTASYSFIIKLKQNNLTQENVAGSILYTRTKVEQSICWIYFENEEI